MKILLKLKTAIFKWKIKRAIRKANRLHELTKYKYLVIKHQNKIRVLSKKKLTAMVAAKMFKKGISVRFLEAKALYVTC